MKLNPVSLSLMRYLFFSYNIYVCFFIINIDVILAKCFTPQILFSAYVAITDITFILHFNQSGLVKKCILDVPSNVHWFITRLSVQTFFCVTGITESRDTDRKQPYTEGL